MTKHTFLAFSALALAACGQTTTVDAPETTTVEGPAAPQVQAMSDAEFVQAVADADAFEIQSSEFAATRSGREQVKYFASMMVRDHTQTSQQLATLASTIQLAAPTPMIDATHQTRLEALRGMNGEDFDDAYLDAQVEAHENAVSAFERYIASAASGPLRDWANSTLPKLREHLTTVQSLENAT